MSLQPGRNDPCPCGSGRKFKKCCAQQAVPPSFTSALDMGHLVALLQNGRYLEVEQRAQWLVQQHSEMGAAWKVLGTALGIQGKPALPALQKAAQLLPQDAEVQNNLGNAFKELGQLQESVQSYRRALAIHPRYADAHHNLGLALNAQELREEAIASYRRAIELQPDDVEIYLSLGVALSGSGQFDAAIVCYRQALTLNPQFAEIYNNLGNVHQAKGQLAEAVVQYRRALELKPDYPLACNNLGTALNNQDQVFEALACYQRALALRPDYAEAHYNLGNVLERLGRLDEALTQYHRALAIQPDYAEALGNIQFSMAVSGRYSKSECLQQARRYGQLLAKRAGARYTTWQCEPMPQRLRIGMVSGDLRNHPVGYFVESLLPHLDTQQIELFAYSTTAKSDAMSARIQPYFAKWKYIGALSDQQAAQCVQRDNVHILLDLSGHTRHDRLSMFAWKPAPVQVTWLGYFATTGVAEMDYLLADPMGVPQDQQDQFTERVWYLPDTRLCFTPPQADVPITPLPAQHAGLVTFGCFQNLSKVNEIVLAAWSRILNAVPMARLRLASKQLNDASVRSQIQGRLAQQGIDVKRVEMHGQVSREDYLASHAEVDMILDTFPYPGGTTTCEALWMGVPTLTLAGNTLLARQGASLLHAAGLNDWIANNEAEYIAKAVAFASDLPALAALRAGLRQQVLASPLFDAPRFARNFEAALWGMWREKGLENYKTAPM